MISLTAMLLASMSALQAAEAPDFEKLMKQYPVSFSYDGQPVDLAAWSAERQDGGDSCQVKYTSPDGKLSLTVTYVAWADFPVVEVRPVLECAGSEPTGIIDDFRSLDFSVPAPGTGVKIRRTTGSLSLFTDFTRHDVLLQNRHECNLLSMSNPLGRAAHWIPYIGVDYDALNGLEIAIGWSGTWRADMSCANDFRFSYGLEGGTHFKMLPGERFQMPYTVIYERCGKSVEEGQVEFHRFMIDHKAPRDSKGRIFSPLLPMTASGGNKTDANMLMIIEKATRAFKDINFDTFWVDAGWYGNETDVPQETNCGPYWWNVGDWRPNPWMHPDGNMKKVARAANKKGMKFLLWFEPERSTIHTPIYAEHPEYFHRLPDPAYDKFCLLDLGNPEAREWITEEICRNIKESGVQVYRQDFNMNPAVIWQGNDEPDRRGVLEIKHINGLYAYWDELHRRFPDMMFESCAGGGTRVDIEMMSRAHSYCRDDAHMTPGSDELCQNITLNTTCYMPFTGGETFSVPVFDTYGWLSHMAAGTVFTPTDFQGMILSREPSAEEIEWFNSMLKVSDRVRTLFFGDFYVLARPELDNSACFVAYQLNKKESGEGFFIVFRREKCLESSVELDLRGIDPDAAYTVEELGGQTCIFDGSQFATRRLTLDAPRTARLFFYKKK